MSKVQDAIDWMHSGVGRSQYAASKQFGIGQSAISVTLARQNSDVSVYAEVGDMVLNKIDAWFVANPGARPATAAKHFGIPESTLRAAYRGQAVTIRRAALRQDRVSERSPDWYAGMEQAASIAEMVGGEYGASIAAAIRSAD